jgi:hypothetical protein
MIGRLTELPRRERMGLILALALVAIMIGDAVVLKPALRQIRDLDQAIMRERAEISRSRGVLQFADSVLEQYSDVRHLLGESGPESETIEGFKSELDELAIRHGVGLRSMRHLNPETSDYMLTYVIDVGDYESDMGNLLRFLDGIHEAPGLMRVRQLTITSQTTNQLVNGAVSVTRVMTRPLAGGEQP